jgi:N,N'-diacetyllegionaminate synthase
MNEYIEIENQRIGKGAPCFVIAEAGVNHNGDIALARELIDVAAKAGADAVKFQTFKAERLVTAEAPKAEYQKQTTSATESQLQMLKRLELTTEAHNELRTACKAAGVQFLSTPFEEGSVDVLVNMGLQLLKIPSGEITNLPFLAHVASKKIPAILSTGMASLGEVEQAVEVFRSCGAPGLVLLHCVSNYPANPADCNLRAMHTMQAAFGLPVGFSDHTPGIETALAAVALGACVIEKHFTIDRNLPGPDHKASLEPAELGSLIRGIRTVESALGDGRKARVATEQNTADVVRKSIVAACDIPSSSRITSDMLKISRPGTGLPPTMLNFVIGRTSRQSIPADTLLSLDMFS